MRKNPDRICWKCGQIIEDRTYRSACYCGTCYADHRKEYKQNWAQMRAIESSQLEIMAAGMLIENYMEVNGK